MYVLTVLDYFSKFPLFFPIRKATASVITKLLEDNVFLMFGVPEFLHCDNGKQFKSREFTKLCEIYKVKIIYSPPYHAQSVEL